MRTYLGRDIQLAKAAVLKLGGALEFSFTLRSTKRTAQKLVVDYCIHYSKAAGHTAAKVFKLKEVTLEGGAAFPASKRQVIQDFTTRKHHAGKHRVEILVNGRVLGGGDFRLVT